jgi:hypothetical protein
MPESVTTDAGYGSEENYTFLEKNKITPFVKFASFDREQRKNHADKQPFHQSHLHYNKEKDRYICPMGQDMEKVKTETSKSANGFKKTIHVYQAKNCSGCPLRSRCHDAKGNRIIKVNHNLLAHQSKARELLKSEEGIKHRKQRCHDVEPVFGQIKHNKNFKRYNLRGKEKVEIETGLLAMAHNLKKMAA